MQIPTPVQISQGVPLYTVCFSIQNSTACEVGYWLRPIFQAANLCGFIITINSHIKAGIQIMVMSQIIPNLFT